MNKELVMKCLEYLDLPENDVGSSYNIGPLKAVLELDLGFNLGL